MRPSTRVSAAVLWGLVVLACGGGCSTEDKVKCGAGTVLALDTCVVEGDGGATNALTFGGVTAVAPVSMGSLFVAWADATGSATPSERMRYTVYLSPAGTPLDFTKPVATTEPGATWFYASKLEPGKAYDVAVRALDEAGRSDANAVVKSGTPAADPTLPGFAGVTSAEPGASGSVVVKWAPAQDNLTPPEAMVYYVYFAEPSGEFDFAKPHLTTKPGATSATLVGLYDPTAVYRFIVRARDAAENTDDNLTTATSRAGADTTPPRFAGCKTAFADSAGSVVVTWDPAVDETTPFHKIAYDVYAAVEEGKFDFGVPATTELGTASAHVEGLASNTVWHFACRARDFSGNRDTNTIERIAKTRLDDTRPSFGGITDAVVDPLARTVLLSWAPGSDDKSQTAAIVYDVYEAEASGAQKFDAPPRASSEPGATSLLVTDLTPEKTLFWVVRARDEGGNHDTNTVEKSGTILVSFRRQVQPIFSYNCAVTGCHVPGNPVAGLILAQGFAFKQLVDVPSTQVPADMRVAPGMPTASYLYKKVSQNPPPVGWQMPAPATGSTLSQKEKDLIRNWITQGAANN